MGTYSSAPDETKNRCTRESTPNSTKQVVLKPIKRVPETETGSCQVTKNGPGETCTGCKSMEPTMQAWVLGVVIF